MVKEMKKVKMAKFEWVSGMSKSILKDRQSFGQSKNVLRKHSCICRSVVFQITQKGLEYWGEVTMLKSDWIISIFCRI